MTVDPRKLVVRRVDRTQANEQSFSHPFNPRSQIHGHSLADLAGLKRTGVWLGRIPAGKQSFAYHAHHREEEWLYVLSGRAIVDVNDERFELAAGDFIGFPAPGCAHLVENPGPDDLVFLSGGERCDAEIADFPRERKRMVRVGGKVAIHDLDSARPFPGLEKL